MERKKRSKGRGWERCYVKKIYGTFGVEMRAYGAEIGPILQTHTHTHTHAAILVVEIWTTFVLSEQLAAVVVLCYV